MAFRTEESVAQGFDAAKAKLIPRSFSPGQRDAAERVILEAMEACGPVVTAYPIWHPLVAEADYKSVERTPSERCGYFGLDHTVYFANGFITCPYGNVERVVDSVNVLADKVGNRAGRIAVLTAQPLACELYAEGATPVLVRCEWQRELDSGHLIPKHLAVPLMLERELPAWRWATRPETWETMRPYLLGEPHGQRSSHFVSQETALAMKKAYVAMVESGMFDGRG